MATIDPSVSALAGLLRQTPPGQVAKVYNDLRVLLESNATGAGEGTSDHLRSAAHDELGTYNAQQLITVKTPTEGAALIVSPAGRIETSTGVRFVDPRSRTSYTFDPLRLRLSDPQDVLVHEPYDQLRSAIDTAARKYVGAHYQDGVTLTFLQTEEEGEEGSPASRETSVPTSAPAQPAQPVEAEPDVPETPEGPPVTVEAHAGGAPDVQAVLRSETAVKDGEEQDVAGEGHDPEQHAQVDAATAGAVEAALDEAEAFAQDQENVQAEGTPEKKELEEEGTLLSKELEETHIGHQGAEHEAQIEAAEVGATGPAPAAPAAPEAGTENEAEPETGAEAETAAEAGDAEPEGASAEPAVPRIPSGAPTFTLHIVGNRYNLANFWAGRWRSTYVFSLPSAAEAEAGQVEVPLKGKVAVQVHYFEEGNVQLSAEHALELPVPTQVDVAAALTGSADQETYTTLAQDIVRCIEQDEQAYHAALETTLSELSERTFRALRRQLPVTKQKLNWERAVSYNLAGDLAR